MTRIPADHPLRRTFIEQPAQTQPPQLPPAAAQPPPAQGRQDAAPASSPPGPSTEPEVLLAAPVHRPPVAVLWVFDDGGTTAELVRIRSASLVIGRTEGDLLIEHDLQISNRHAEIVRVLEDEHHYRWYLRDLESTNGTFVRIRQAVLKDNAEIMIARNRFRFVATPPADQQQEEKPPEIVPDLRSTCTWCVAESSVGPPDRPCLLELHADCEGRRLPLVNDWLLVGRDSQECMIALDHGNVNPRHAKIFRDDQDRWHIEDLGSLNGVWLRITEIPLGSRSCFLLGEQLFAVVLS